MHFGRAAAVFACKLLRGPFPLRGLLCLRSSRVVARQLEALVQEFFEPGWGKQLHHLYLLTGFSPEAMLYAGRHKHESSGRGIEHALTRLEFQCTLGDQPCLNQMAMRMSFGARRIV